jgi:hypothetical protein
MQSNRVDIGVFVHNGRYYSAPGFVTFYTLDREGRTYTEEGRLVEIDYTAGSSVIDFDGVTDWSILMRTILDDGNSLGKRLLKERLGPKEEARLEEIASEYRPLGERRKESHQARQAAKEFLFESPYDSTHSVADRLLSDLNAIKDNARLYVEHSKTIDRLLEALPESRGKKTIRVRIEQLRELGIVNITDEGADITPLRGGHAAADLRLTGFERGLLQRLHLEILNNVFYADFLDQPATENFCDLTLTAAKPWCDFYHYAQDGTCLGWTRFADGKKVEFHADGNLILEKDSLGRTTTARTVIYRGNRANPRQRWELKWHAGDEIVEYTYQSPEDFAGTSSDQTKVEDPARLPK